ncbi:unnamed protein product, partial [Callosobruchus maculatus]
KLKTNY